MSEHRPRRSDRHHRGRRRHGGTPPVIRSAPPRTGATPPGRRTPTRAARRRGEVIGSGRPVGRRPVRRNLLAPIAVLLVLAVVAGGVGFWLLTRPAAVSITVTPADAVIAFNGTTAAGTLEASDLEPGPYRVRVERKLESTGA